MADVRLIDANALDGHKFPAYGAALDARERGWNECIEYLKARAKTIDAVPVVHGRWKTHFYSNCVDTYGNLDTCAECSECGFRWHSVREAKSWLHYCPDCGAKMDGKEG